MDVHERRRAFHTLDGLRGIAALLVVARHAGPLSAGVSFPENFLAVDLFFLLSGFVIAFAYDSRLTQPGFVGRFLLIRLIRLYPLYLLGLLVGAAYRGGSVLGGTEGWTAGRLVEALLLGLLLVPQTPLTAMGSSELDGPTWTLLPELLANMVYALFFRWMSRAVLGWLVAAGAVAVVACRVRYGTLDAGWEFAQWPVIGARLLFSFFGGVLLFRLLGDRRQARPWLAWGCVLAVGVALSVTPPEGWRAAYELAMVLVLFPLVLWAGCRSEPAGVSAGLFRFLGVISYAVYILHQPVATLFGKLLERGMHLQVERFANFTLLAFLAALVVGTWLVDAYYDAPVRRWLTRRLARRAPRRELTPS